MQLTKAAFDRNHGKDPSGSLILTVASAAWSLEPQEQKNKFRDIALSRPKGTKAPLTYKRKKVLSGNTLVAGNTSVAGNTFVAGNTSVAGNIPVSGSNPVSGSIFVELVLAQGSVVVVDAPAIASTSTAVPLQSPSVPTYPELSF